MHWEMHDLCILGIDISNNGENVCQNPSSSASGRGTPQSSSHSRSAKNLGFGARDPAFELLFSHVADKGRGNLH